MKKHIKSVLSLTIICAFVAVMMALTNAITAPVIKENMDKQANETLLVVYPNGQDFEELDISKYELPESVTVAYKEASGGYVFTLEVAGYNPGMVIMCGIDAQGVVTGSACISSGETLGAEKTYGTELEGKTQSDIDAVATVAGATKTTLAYKNAVKDALNAKIILDGGSVDLRSEEEILNDNLKEALPAGEGKFTELFLTEELELISKIYKADNGKGAVCVVEDKFIAVDEKGVVLSETSNKDKISAEAKLALNSKLTQVSASNLPESIEKAFKTDSGNFVFYVNASGYGIKGNPMDPYAHPSGEYIKIKISVSNNGKVISCITESQGESKGVGDVCADKSYYEQYNGKDINGIEGIDVISGATITSNGYKNGVADAIKAAKILKGVAG